MLTAPFSFCSSYSLAREAQKLMNLSALKVSSLLSIGAVAYLLAFFTHSTLREWQLILAVVMGVVIVIVIPVLYLQNTHISNNRPLRLSESIYAFIFAGLATTPVLATWIKGTADAYLLLVLVAMTTVIIPILYVENTRLTRVNSYEESDIRLYLKGLIFAGFSIGVGLIGWGSGTMSTVIVKAIPQFPELLLVK
ncbi:MAG: hypothetical protein OXN25_00905 [Candidatus Poribacteria bacterium]|nr:hypothetical protein [Candidatus Poribacteria bacterium]